MVTLVTGGTGLLGLNVVRQLAARGENLRLLVRPSKKPRLGLADLKIEIAPGDVTDAESVNRAMQGVTKVYHLAALTWQGPWQSVRKQLEQVNIGGTQNVCDAAMREGIERMVYCSSTVAVGKGTLENPVTEDSTWNLQGYGPYYDTKRAAEELVHRLVVKGLPAVITNPGFMLGPWDIKPTSGTIVLEAARRRTGVPLYTIGGGNNICDVEDVAKGHLLAMEKGRIGERYILGNENLTYKQIFTLANAVCGKNPPRIGIPVWALAPVGPVLDAVGYFFPDQLDNFNSAVIKSGGMGLYANSQKAIRELGLSTTPPRKSMEKVLHWFKEHGYVKA